MKVLFFVLFVTSFFMTCYFGVGWSFDRGRETAKGKKGRFYYSLASTMIFGLLFWNLNSVNTKVLSFQKKELRQETIDFSDDTESITEEISEDIVEETVESTRDTTEEIENQKEEEKEKLSNEIVAELLMLPKESDEMSDISFYYNSYLENYTNVYQVYPYLAAHGGELEPENYLNHSDFPVISLKIRYSYVSDRWLFIEDGIQIKTDNDKYELGTSYSDWKRDNGSGDIWEWYVSSPVSVDMYEDMANSQETLIRYHGKKYYDDRYMTQPEKDAILQIISIYSKYKQLENLL